MGCERQRKEREWEIGNIGLVRFSHAPCLLLLGRAAKLCIPESQQNKGRGLAN